MLSRLFASAVVLLALSTFVLAETYRGAITKIEDDTITVSVRKKGERKGEEKSFKYVSDKVKVYKLVPKGDGEKGFKDEDAKLEDLKKAVKAGAKGAGGKGRRGGVTVTIETEGEGDKETVKSIKFGTFGGGRQKKQKTDE